MTSSKLEIYNPLPDTDQSGKLQVVIVADRDLYECNVHASLMYESQVTALIQEYHMSELDTFDTVYCDSRAYIDETTIIVIFEDDMLQNSDLINTHMLNMTHFIKQVATRLMSCLEHVHFDLVGSATVEN